MVGPGRDGASENPTLFYFDDFDEGRTALNFQVEAGKLELGEGIFSFPQPLKIQLDVQRALDSYRLEGVASGVLAGECCRCLAAARGAFAAELQLLLQRRQVSDEERAALEEDDEIELVDLGTKEIDLQPFWREAVILELPMRIYCRDECKGLCPQCGINLNESTCSCVDEQVDPRWAALAQLKS